MSRPCAALLVLLALLGPAAAAEPPTVTIENASRPTGCAEEDNVYVRMSGDGIAGFAITARHPAYLTGLRQDSMAPDFEGCDMSGDPSFAFEPVTLTLYEDAGLALVGHRFASFWRPDQVPLRVGEREVEGLHLVQLFDKTTGRRIEYLVLYPADGYWRLKPLPPPHLPDSGYGSSFLIGPVEEAGRPVVALAAVEFMPAERAFRLRFARGGGAVLRVAALDAQQARLEIAFAPAAASDLPFAALRSMFVAPDNADVALVSWRGAVGAPAQTLPILAPFRVPAAGVGFGRALPSRHNASAPDLFFEGFAAAAR